MLKLGVEVRGDVGRFLTEERRAGARSVTAAMRSTGLAVKGDWRGQIARAGLGTRLGNTIRSEVYPRSGASMDAATMIWSRAPKIVGAFDKGATIRSQNGFWLAIPLPAAGKGRRGRITPGQWEARTGRRLRFVYRSGRSALLVDDGQRLARPGGRLSRGAAGPRLARSFGNRTVPIFALVPQVTLRKRLDLYPAALRLAAGLPRRIVAGWRSPA